MNAYDPTKTPDPKTWLEMDEQERIALVKLHHDTAGVEVDNPTLHAAMHTLVENQLALDDECVRETFDRLLVEGLDRHDALHAVGSVLAEHLWGVMKRQTEVSASAEEYYRGLRKLTAKKWRATR